MLHSIRSGQQQEAEKVDEEGGERGEEEEGVAACCWGSKPGKGEKQHYHVVGLLHVQANPNTIVGDMSR
jgi:hypothetical protein